METKINCPLCKDANAIKSGNSNGAFIKCRRCGNFVIHHYYLEELKHNFDAKVIHSKLSSWVSEKNKLEPYNTPTLYSGILEEVNESRDKTIKEKFNCFMNTIMTLDKCILDIYDFNNCYITSTDELHIYFLKAVEKNYIRHMKPNRLNFNGITFDGLEYIESLSEINKESKNIFVAFHFTDEMQQIFDTDIKYAIESIGFNYVRVSSSTTDTDVHINDDIIGKIKSSKIIISDFTGQRQSVYFEAGYAMGLNIPVIWTCKESEVEKLSFDTRQYPHILWKNKDDFVDKLIKRIKAIT
ncbi:MAG: hypothetical protein DRG78_23750 [Epsilonproteobacteria bacterium]|nr:MAG: hypothetical protein DRG78_23750 [Campylobacterota bacterium]